MRKCPVCNGSGNIEEFGDSDNDMNGICLTCGGSGVVED